ncbi:MAG TPA: hypothetical protein VFS24_04570 [Steroidobacteraceae bacterium]|nr:hypothetical protein [Steroidobacteraceae bacterium]
MAEEDYVSALEKTVPIILSGLLEQGFQFLGIKRWSKDRLIGTHYEALLENWAAGRRVSVTLYPAALDRPDAVGLTISIIRASRLHVVAYLKKHGASEDEIAKFFLVSHQGSLEERLRAVLLAFRDFLDRPALQDIVAGKEWESAEYGRLDD